jgi:hypothetical protein
VEKKNPIPFRHKQTGEEQSAPDVLQTPLALPRIISAEANLLKLPLFALARNSLTMTGIECRGEIRREGKKHQFTFKSTRGMEYHYPGTLSRTVHMAFLSMVREHGFPFENPLPWTWRDLCRRMGLRPGGKTQHELKRAILATQALRIYTDYGIYSKSDGKFIRTEAALTLYSEVWFEGQSTSSGTTADANAVWLAPWYLQNLNAFHSAPLDYDLWLRFDSQSHVASRLYEFLLIKFHGPRETLTFNYPTLVQFLPLKPMRKLSYAHRQLDQAFDLLIRAGFLKEVAWEQSRLPRDLALLRLYRGKQFASEGLLPFHEADDAGEAIEVREIHLRPEELVAQFYELWSQTKPAVKPGEKQQARDLIEKYGPERAKEFIPLIVKRMKMKFPDAKTFGATTRYVDEVAADYERQERARLAKEKATEEARKEREADEKKRGEEKEFRAAWIPVWANAPQAEREEIETQLKAKNPYYRDGMLPSFFELECLQELARRRKGQAASEAAP